MLLTSLSDSSTVMTWFQALTIFSISSLLLEGLSLLIIVPILAIDFLGGLNLDFVQASWWNTLCCFPSIHWLFAWCQGALSSWNHHNSPSVKMSRAHVSIFKYWNVFCSIQHTITDFPSSYSWCTHASLNHRWRWALDCWDDTFWSVLLSWSLAHKVVTCRVICSESWFIKKQKLSFTEHVFITGAT